MKKILSIFILLILLTACTKEKFSLNKEYYNNPVFEEIDSTKLKKLEQDKQSFLVMVYTAGCTSCMNFEKILTEFTIENNLQIFRINIADIAGTKLSGKIKYTPTLAIYKEGKVYRYLNAESNDDTKYYKSTTSLKEWLEKYILLENIT